MTGVIFALLSLPVYLLMLWPLVVASRRVLGVPIRPLRAFVGAAAGWGVAVRIMSLLFPTAQESPSLFVGLALPIAGCAFLTTLVFLFLAEMALPSGSGLGLVGRLRSLRGKFARARRYSQVSRIAVRHGIGHHLGGRRASADGTRHALLARSLRRALEEAGVTFVKLGQVLSTRPDILPPVFIDELSRLQDHVRPADHEAIDQELTKAFGRPVSEVFEEFDTTPIATASIAQVYRARMHSGEHVVVKVRKPGVDAIVERDLDIVHRVALSLDRRTKWARSLGLVDLVEGFAAALTEELDFRVEARNMAAVDATRTDESTMSMPTVFAELSSERVLVMRLLDGSPIRTAVRSLDSDQRHGLARTLLDCVLRQVLEHGVFHADPHPGNVMLLADGRLGLLDFGSVGRLDAGLRNALQELLAAVDRGDPGALRDALLEIVDRPEQIDEHRLERALGSLVSQHMSDGQSMEIQMFTDLFRIVADFRLAIPPSVASVFRALGTMEGTLTVLCPGFNMLTESRAFAGTLRGERMQPTSLRNTATEELLALLPVLRRIPRRIDHVTAALEQGRLSVNVRLLADERDRGVLTGMLNELLLAMTGTAAGIMAVLLLASTGGPRVAPDVTLNQLLGYNLLVISAMLGLRLLFVVFRAQHRRLAQAGPR